MVPIYFLLKVINNIILEINQFFSSNIPDDWSNLLIITCIATCLSMIAIHFINLCCISLTQLLQRWPSWCFCRLLTQSSDVVRPRNYPTISKSILLLLTFQLLSSSINHQMCPSSHLNIFSLHPSTLIRWFLSLQPLSIHLLASTHLSVHPCILSCTATLLICLFNTYLLSFAYTLYINYKIQPQSTIHPK